MTVFQSLVVEGHRLSVSIGVTRARPGESVDGLLRRADQALYAAKRAGKKRHQLL